MYLELKKKVFGLVNKRRTALKLDEAYAFVSTEIQPELKDYMNKQVMQEIGYFLQRYDLEPKVYLADGSKGFIAIEKGSFNIQAGTDGIQAAAWHRLLLNHPYSIPS